MARDVRRIVESLFVAAREPYVTSLWQPPADVYQTERGWIVKFDLAGVRPDDLELTVYGRRLTLRGVRRDWTARECQHAYSMEISYNRFERSIELPCDLDSFRIMSEYRDGMLIVSLEAEATAR